MRAKCTCVPLGAACTALFCGRRVAWINTIKTAVILASEHQRTHRQTCTHRPVISWLCLTFHQRESNWEIKSFDWSSESIITTSSPSGSNEPLIKIKMWFLICNHRFAGHNYEIRHKDTPQIRSTQNVKPPQNEGPVSLKAIEYLNCHLVVWPVILVLLGECQSCQLALLGYVSLHVMGLPEIQHLVILTSGYQWSRDIFIQHPLRIFIVSLFDLMAGSFPDHTIKAFLTLKLHHPASWSATPTDWLWLLTLWCVQEPASLVVNIILCFSDDLFFF